MKAIVYEQPNKLSFKEVPEPKASAPQDVLIKIEYGGICGTDLVVWQGGLTRVKPPVILGHEFVGTVVQDMSGKYYPGDKVTVEPLISCGKCLACRSGNYHVCNTLKLQGVDVDGGFTEYVVSPVNKVYKLSDSLAWEEAAFVEPVAVAVHMIRRVGIEPGDYVTVLGSGTIGILVALLCREMLTKKVLLSEINPFRQEIAKAYGFDVADPKKTDLKSKILEETDREGSDVTFELTGHPDGALTVSDITRVRGKILQGSVFKQPPVVQLQHITLKEQSMIGARVYNGKDYTTAIKIIEEKIIDLKPLLTEIVPLSEAIPKGFEAIKKGDPVMKILVAPFK